MTICGYINKHFSSCLQLVRRNWNCGVCVQNIKIELDFSAIYKDRPFIDIANKETHFK